MRVCGIIRSTRVRVAGIGLTAFAALATGGAALAAGSPYDDIAISSTMHNSYRYSIGGGPLVAVDPSPDNAHLRVGANNGGFVSEVGIDLTSSLSGDSFSFLHNGYCVGTCTVRIETVLTFNLTNSGNTKRDLRWDSLITPGHMAQLGSDGSALFHLIVVENNVDTFLGGSEAQFRGETFGWFDQIDTGAGFSGFNSDIYSEGAGHFNARYFADWSATAFSLNLLTLTPKSTTQLNYYSWVDMSYSADCTSLSDCGGVQVAFGDPRTKGGSTITSRLSTLGTSFLTPDLEPYIGREFAAYDAPSAFVTPLTPMPSNPPVLPSVVYVPTFVTQLPEPSSWAMLVIGFGVTGFALRHRRSPGRAAA